MNKTKIFIDSGDPKETKTILDKLGQIDGQTTNPSLIAKNPEIMGNISNGKKFDKKEILSKYKEIVTEISNIIPNGDISIEVYADENTNAKDMVDEAEMMYTWIPNGRIKLPTIKEGLRAAQILAKNGVKLNMTLCFSQYQAAAVYSATKENKGQDIYLSPFIGRLDDKGINGIDLIKNIITMFKNSDGHVKVLSASVRSMDHFLYCKKIQSDIITAPIGILSEYAQNKNDDFDETTYGKNLKHIEYKEINLDKYWDEYDIYHELTDVGLEKFAQDWNNLLIK